MTKAELYRYRADDFSTRFQAMRQTEWQLCFQVYAAYGVIGGAYRSAINQVHAPWFVMIAGINLVLIVFFTGWYLSVRTQQRLAEFLRLKLRYLGLLHDELGVPEEEVAKLPGAGFYAPRAQIFLSGIFAAAVCVYQVALFASR
jgi:hypothetical protein